MINFILGFHIATTPVNLEWSAKTYELQVKMISLGCKKELSKLIIDTCKKKAKDPRNCVITASMIASAESSFGNASYKNNVFGVNIGRGFISKQEAIKDWIDRYNKHWYKHLKPSDFYPIKGGVSKTRYCTNEISSGSKIGCPNGLKHATNTFNFLTK